MKARWQLLIMIACTVFNVWLIATMWDLRTERRTPPPGPTSIARQPEQEPNEPMIIFSEENELNAIMTLSAPSTLDFNDIDIDLTGQKIGINYDPNSNAFVINGAYTSDETLRHILTVLLTAWDYKPFEDKMLDAALIFTEQEPNEPNQ